MTMHASPTIPSQSSHGTAGRIGGIVLTLLMIGVFVVMWAGLAGAALADGRFLTDFWAWITALPLIPAVVAWILLLPIAVGAWAWTASLEPVVMGLVVIGLAAWTGVALAGTMKSLRGR
jgi:hypothetical protein